MRKIILYSLLSLFCISGYAQLKEEDKKIFIHEGISLPYVQVNQGNVSAKRPLVILLHGIGSRGNDNKKPYNFFESFAKKFTNDFSARLIIPQCPDGVYWSSGMKEKKDRKGKPTGTYEYDANLDNGPTTAMKALMALIQSQINSGEIDAGRVYVVGVSMGGFGTHELLWRMPAGTFAAAVPICGGTDSDPNKLQHYGEYTPVWLFHGAKDKVVLPSNSRIFCRTFQKIPESFVKYTEYASSAHTIWNTVFANGELLPWLFGQRNQEIGYYKISAPSDGRTLTKVNDALTLDSFKVQGTQNWFLTKAGNNSYYLYITDGSCKYLTVRGGVLSFIKTSSPQKTEYWKLKKTWKGTYLIESESSGQRLFLDGSRILLSGDHSNMNGQEWDITPSRLFMIGTSTKARWTVSKAIELAPDTDNDGIFYWTGTLTAGEFKFITSRLSSKYASYNALEPTTPAVGGKHKLATNPGGTYNNKFKIAKKGVYNLTVDLINKSLLVEPANNKSLSLRSLNSDNDVDDEENPFKVFAGTGSVEITSISEAEVDKVTLYNLNGKILTSKRNIKCPASIGENLRQGVYIIEVLHNGKVFYEKILLR